MEVYESNGIVPAVTPAWPEFTAAAANGIYMLTANYAVNGANAAAAINRALQLSDIS